MLLVATLLLLSSLGSATCSYIVARRYYTWKYEELMRHRRLGANGYIYFVQLVQGHRTLVKIGRSVDPIKRIRTLRTAAPYGIKVLGIMPALDDVASEAYIHRKFASLRLSMRGEWFQLTVPLLLYINAVSDPVLTATIRKAVK